MTAEAADAERTDAIAKDWEKAVSYAITDEDIERAKLLVGVDVAAKSREYIQTATTDNIRNRVSDRRTCGFSRWRARGSTRVSSSR